jgi:cation transport regulator ChaB
MPYATTADLPANIKALPATKQRQWMHIWNSAYDACISGGGQAKSCESQAFARANGVVLKESAMDEELEDLQARLEDIQEAGRVLSAANKDVIRQMMGLATGKMHGFPGASRLAELCQGLLDASGDGEEVTEAQMAEIVEAFEHLQEKEFTAERRKELAAKGHALPDGSYPIENTQDLHNAIQAIGRASNPAAAKRHIIKRARALGATDMLPDDWKSNLSESVQLVEAVSGTEGREWDVILIEQGQSGNGTYYDASVLQAAVPLFEGVSSFADHASDSEMRNRPERSIRDKVGKFSQPEYGTYSVKGKMVEGVRARFKVFAPWLREVLLEADRAGEDDFLGFSIDAVGRTSPRKVGGKSVRWVEAIEKVRSVDVVTTPAAGGRTVRLVASQAPDQERRTVDVDPEELQKLIRDQVTAVLTESMGTAVKEAVTAVQEAQKPQQEALQTELAKLQESNARRGNEARVETKLTGLKLSDYGKRRLRETLLDTLTRREVADEEMDVLIKESVDYEAAIAGNNARPPSIREAIKIMASEADKYDAMIQGLFSNVDEMVGDAPIPRFKGLREAYCKWTGSDPWDYEESGPFAINRAMATNYDSALDHTRLRESLATATWGEIYADNLYIRMIKQYRANPMYDQWRKLVSDVEDVPDFQTRHWARIGGYGDLPVVAEGGPYTALSTPTDEEVTYAVSKRGGTDDVTFEAITNDRFQAVRRIPDAMARSASRTLFKFVMNLITTDNPTMDYDAVALYIAAHNNTGVLPLTNDNLAITQAAMRAQTAYSEALEILGMRNAIKYLIVPAPIEMLAYRIVNPSDAYGIY